MAKFTWQSLSISAFKSEMTCMGKIKPIPDRRCHVVKLKSREFLGSTSAQAAAVAVCHTLIAWLRNWRNVFSRNQMALDVEGVVDGGVGREKSLR